MHIASIGIDLGKPVPGDRLQQRADLSALRFGCVRATHLPLNIPSHQLSECTCLWLRPVGQSLARCPIWSNHSATRNQSHKEAELSVVNPLVPAAQYLRASTERQQYSTEYQSKIISEYENAHGYQIVKEYSDEARSGLTLKHRPALRELLADVVKGQTAFRVILVFDVTESTRHGVR